MRGFDPAISMRGAACLSSSAKQAFVISSIQTRALPREPMHIHVRGRGCDAKIRPKIRMEPEVVIYDSYGFNSRELADILKTVEANRPIIAKAWHEHFGD